MSRRTKIVATIGPASESPESLKALIAAGADVCRLNLSHGTVEEHLARLRAVRDAAASSGRHVAVLADLPGPKIRAGSFPEGGVDLAPGSVVRFVPGDAPSSAHQISVDYDDLLTDVVMGDRIILGDGGISLRVVSVTGDAVLAEVESGGKTQGRPGVHLQCEGFTLRAPTAEDLELAEQMAVAGVDYIALSFARSAADIDALRAVVGDRARILAKVETGSAIAAIAEIADAADAVMVARGDLGIDVALEDVPHLQKRIIRHCVEVGTPVVTATQMLESMIDAPTPTRAEVSDVANAVFDGTDAVMLSGETAIGRDPALVVRTMATIAERAEREADYRQWGTRLVRAQRGRADGTAELDDSEFVADRISESIAHAAWQAADDVGASTIICCTRSGRCARNMARFRPAARLLGISPHESTRRALALSWGVEPLAVDEAASTDEMVWFAVERAVAGGWVAAGDTVVVIAGAPDRASGAAADVMRIVRVG
ncbi:pyruvate kinase [Desertimonas flava]|uniref:pyruvate kinase n=1 Tax=Desertimonas flava TaxID=2064846 RepID=UPI0013C487F8|nr:pyruvate kinase [Desertimonas flava]